MILISFLIILDLVWHFFEYKERKRLHKCWQEVFDDKLDNMKQWMDLAKVYLEKINLQSEKSLIHEKTIKWMSILAKYCIYGKDLIHDATEFAIHEIHPTYEMNLIHEYVESEKIKEQKK